MRGSRLLHIASVERRDEEQGWLLSLDLLDSIERLDRTEVIDSIGTLGASLASSSGREDDGTSSLELGSKLGGGSILEREEDRGGAAGSDVAEVVFGPHERFDAVT